MTKKINIDAACANVLAESLSEFVMGIDKKEQIEGVFLSPYGIDDEITGFVVGIVYDGNIVDSITSADRLPLSKAYHTTGYNFDVKPITIDWYKGEFGEGESEFFPVKGLLKTGSIFYDKNGTLSDIKKELVNDIKVVGKSHVVVNPSIQYRKTM